MRLFVSSFNCELVFSNMPRFVLICCVFVVIACLGLSSAAPLENLSGNYGKEQMIERFVEFLRQDSQFAIALNKDPALAGGLVRNRRDTEMDVENIDTTVLDTENTEGFFDRAAKFVMEVLQRFLRWINTDK